MIKRIATITLLFISLATFGQVKETIVKMKTWTTPFVETYNPDQLIRVATDSSLYTLTHATTIGQTMTTVRTNGWARRIGSINIDTAKVAFLNQQNTFTKIQTINDNLFVRKGDRGFDVNFGSGLPNAAASVYSSTSTGGAYLGVGVGDELTSTRDANIYFSLNESTFSAWRLGYIGDVNFTLSNDQTSRKHLVVTPVGNVNFLTNDFSLINYSPIKTPFSVKHDSVLFNSNNFEIWGSRTGRMFTFIDATNNWLVSMGHYGGDRFISVENSGNFYDNPSGHTFTGDGGVTVHETLYAADDFVVAKNATVKTFKQNDPPTDSDMGDASFAFWIDSNDGDKLYLIYRQGATVKKVLMN